MANRHELVAVLDRSGSMGSKAADVIGGYNSLIERTLKDSQDTGVPTFVTLVLFDTRYQVVYASTPITDVEPLTDRVYQTGGNTALMDAVGAAIEACKKSIKPPKQAKKSTNKLDAALAVVDPPKVKDQVSVTFAIFTDGEENQSTTYSREQIATSIGKLTKQGWTFTYLGADQDQWTASRIAQGLGIAKGNTRGYDKSQMGETFALFSAGTTSRLRSVSQGLVGSTVDFFEEAEAVLQEDSNA
ncbi:MAG: VWA domain-containing protein [Armatimonadetes bacterium]|nr:VWA domain-containing protein [Armatimonadota bacterium]